MPTPVNDSSNLHQDELGVSLPPPASPVWVAEMFVLITPGYSKGHLLRTTAFYHCLLLPRHSLTLLYYER